MLQHVTVALLVLGCGAYALWTLAPKAPRRRLALALAKLPLPGCVQGPLAAAARQQGGCACDGCDRGKQAQPAPAATQPMVFVPRKAQGAAPIPRR